MRAARKSKTQLQAIPEVVWVDGRLHEEALTALVAANKPALGLTDRTSLRIMRERGIETAFRFARCLAQQGFRLLPSP